jgi:hypothetical protein
MDNDIVPGLLADIQKQFYLETTQSKKLKAALLKIEKNKATYQDVNEFAIEVGETLSKVLSDNIYSEILPDQKMYYNIAQRILEPTLKNNYDLIYWLCCRRTKKSESSSKSQFKSPGARI